MNSNALSQPSALSYTKEAELYKQKASRASKQAELERYFPGLYSQKNSSSLKTKQGEGSAFSTQLKAQIKQAKLSRADIQKEIQSDPERKKLYEAALDFQALFVGSMLTSMRNNLNPKADLLYGGFRQKIFEDMLYEEYARMLSRTDDFGLADDIYRQGQLSLETSKKDPEA